MRTSFSLLMVMVGLSLGGCQKATWTKAELVDWYGRFERDKPKFGYSGSDANYHYFKTRPIDSWVLPRVPRSEITIADERPPSALGRRVWFYLVDPMKDFAKIPNSDVPDKT